MDYLFPELCPQCGRDVLSMPLYRVFEYAESAFPQYRALCLQARAAYRAISEPAPAQIAKNDTAFHNYLLGICQFYFYCGMTLAIREFGCNACSDMDCYRETLDDRFFDFCDSEYLRKLRRLAEAGVRANSHLIRNQEAQRRHLLLETKVALSVRYLVVIAGYEKMILELAQFSELFSPDAQELAEVHRAFRRVNTAEEPAAYLCLSEEALDPERQAALEARIQATCDAYLADLRRQAEKQPADTAAAGLPNAARSMARIMSILRGENPDD